MRGFRGWLQRFMAGRYGTDKLNSFLLWTAVILMVIGLVIPNVTVRLILMAVYYTLWGWSIFRRLSRNPDRRYRENRRFLLLIDRFKDRQHRYFDCPKCRQMVRVPRGKGKISIT